MPITTIQYDKLCIICCQHFLAKRISTVYCSSKCRNKARGLPAKMIENLIQKQLQSMNAIEGPSKGMREFLRRNDLDLSPAEPQNERLVPIVKPDLAIAHIIPLSEQQVLIDRATRQALAQKMETIGKGDDAIEFTPVDLDKDLL